MATYGTPPFIDCTARGDRRFCEFYARIRRRRNRSISDIYKSAVATTTIGLDALYSALWTEYLDENHDLAAVLIAASGLSNPFAENGEPCQARELWRIRTGLLAKASAPVATAPAAAPASSMRRLAIIGTAGRKDDAARLSAASFDRMVAIARDLVSASGATHLISGGAAWADHVAVALALDGVISARNLTLHLPASVADGQFDPQSRDGGTSNYYHRMFSQKLGRNSVRDITTVASQGARLAVNDRGFFARNIDVASTADIILAFTFGHGAPWTVDKFAPEATAASSHLKDGGTAHTWNHARCEKYHVTLAALA